MVTRFIVRGVVFLLGVFLALSGLSALHTWLEDLAASGGSSGQLALQFAVGLFFLLAGAGLALSVTLVPRLMRKREERLENAYPDAPWMQWNKEWASGRMVVAPKMSIVIGCSVIGVAWNVLVGAVLYTVYGANPERLRAFAQTSILHGLGVVGGLLFIVLVGLIPFFFSVREFHMRRFGATTFVMFAVPGVIGGRLSGTVETGFREAPQHGISIELSCSRMRRPGSRPDHVLWSEKREVPVSQVLKGPTGLGIPVSFDIPPNLEETEEPCSGQRTAWHLTVSTDRRDGKYECIFEVPVFRVRKSAEVGNGA